MLTGTDPPAHQLPQHAFTLSSPASTSLVQLCLSPPPLSLSLSPSLSLSSSVCLCLPLSLLFSLCCAACLNGLAGGQTPTRLFCSPYLLYLCLLFCAKWPKKFLV